jgi:hypothetical protein
MGITNANVCKKKNAKVMLQIAIVPFGIIFLKIINFIIIYNLFKVN